MAILTVTQNDLKCEGDWQPSKRAAQRDTADKALKQLKAMYPEDACQEGQYGGDAGTAGDADVLRTRGDAGQNMWGQANHHGYGRTVAWGMFSGYAFLITRSSRTSIDGGPPLRPPPSLPPSLRDGY